MLIRVSASTAHVWAIIDSDVTPDAVQFRILQTAGQLLMSANRKLRAELDDARQQIKLHRDLMDFCSQESRMDVLTRLPNRRALDDEVIRVFAQHRRDSSAFSMMLIDFDRFKEINDRYGHMVGDQLLKSFSRSLIGMFRETDIVARYGGDEFVVILPGTTKGDACGVAERVRSEVASGIHAVGELELQMTVSIGVKEVTRGQVVDEVFRNADEAMYQAKKGGRNCCYYHEGATCHRYRPVVKQDQLDSNSSRDHLLEFACDDSSNSITADALSETGNAVTV